MFDHEWISDLDAAAACDALAATHRELRETECRQLVLAAHWIDLHAPADEPDAPTGAGRRVLPGMERTVRAGADGTPEIGEFACAEFAALQDMHPLAGKTLLRKVANLRHRHPLLWDRVRRGEVAGWKALETARIVGRDDYTLSLEQARWVDEQTRDWITALPWGQYLDLLEARITACDPEAADLRRREAEARQFVTSSRTNEHGLRTFIAQALAGDVIRVVALIDRVAEVLQERGDLSPVGARRSVAFGMLANPAHLLALLAGAAQDAEDGAASSDETGGGATDPDFNHREEPDLLGHGDLHPADDDADDPAGTRTTSDLGGLAAFAKHLPDLSKVLPKVVLYIHVTQQAFEAGTGVARMEGVGPVTVEQVRRFLRHSHVSPVRVVDLADQRSVDSYEFPSSLREAVHLTSPRDVFPWATHTGRRQDIDHPVPYLPPSRGGPPGQTRLGNAAPMTRLHHRLKTFGRWDLRQPEPGTRLWRSPHGHYWLTTTTGTHPLTRGIGRRLWDAVEPNIAPEHDRSSCGCPQGDRGVHLPQVHLGVA